VGPVGPVGPTTVAFGQSIGCQSGWLRQVKLGFRRIFTSPVARFTHECTRLDSPPWALAAAVQTIIVKETAEATAATRRILRVFRCRAVLRR
jgi:hypothetical protein